MLVSSGVSRWCNVNGHGLVLSCNRVFTILEHSQFCPSCSEHVFKVSQSASGNTDWSTISNDLLRAATICYVALRSRRSFALFPDEVRSESEFSRKSLNGNSTSQASSGSGCKHTVALVTWYCSFMWVAALSELQLLHLQCLSMLPAPSRPQMFGIGGFSCV